MMLYVIEFSSDNKETRVIPVNFSSPISKDNVCNFLYLLELMGYVIIADGKTMHSHLVLHPDLSIEYCIDTRGGKLFFDRIYDMDMWDRDTIAGRNDHKVKWLSREPIEL